MGVKLYTGGSDKINQLHEELAALRAERDGLHKKVGEYMKAGVDIQTDLDTALEFLEEITMHLDEINVGSYKYGFPYGEEETLNKAKDFLAKSGKGV